MKKRKKILFFIIALIVALFLDLTFITIDFLELKVLKNLFLHIVNQRMKKSAYIME